MGWSPAMQQMVTMKYEYADFALSLSPPNTRWSYFQTDISVTACHIPIKLIQCWSNRVDLTNHSRDICLKQTPQSICIHCNHFKGMQGYSILPKIRGQAGIQTKLNNLKVILG